MRIKHICLRALKELLQPDLMYHQLEMTAGSNRPVFEVISPPCGTCFQHLPGDVVAVTPLLFLTSALLLFVSLLSALTATHHDQQHVSERLHRRPSALLLQPLPDGHQPRSLPCFHLLHCHQPSEPSGLSQPGPQRADKPAEERSARQRQGSHAESQQQTGQLPGQGLVHQTARHDEAAGPVAS